MTQTDKRHLVPVKYIGKKKEKIDNVAGTGLAWSIGQIHYVPPLTAQKLSRVTDVWQIVDDQTIENDPAAVGLVLTETESEPNDEQPKEPDAHLQTFDLPNLSGMTKPDIATYAQANFNVTLPATDKKEEMITQVVTLANSRAAGEIE